MTHVSSWASFCVIVLVQMIKGKILHEYFIE